MAHRPGTAQYAAAVSERLERAKADNELDGDVAVEANRWLAWVIDRANRSDPLTRLPTWLERPQLPSYELSEFMNHVPVPMETRYQPESY